MWEKNIMWEKVYLPAFWIFLMVVLLITFILLGRGVHAKDFGYQEPNVALWYDTLKQPDNPTYGCCGEGDAYYADKVESCQPEDGSYCVVVAIITDTRDDVSRQRLHRDVGTRVVIPQHKIRRPASENPTDHNIVFLSIANVVLCWEPAPLI